MSELPPLDPGVFSGGPPVKLQTWLGLIRAGDPRLRRRILIAIGIIWLPLVVLSTWQGQSLGNSSWIPFLFDFGAQGRFLIVPVVLIFAESFCLPRLGLLAAQFVESGLVTPAEYPRYRQALASTARLMNATWAEGLAILLSYGLVALLLFFEPGLELPYWHGAHSGARMVLSPAGWWAMLVSLPLLVLLELGWLWRLFLWTRFLWLMSQLRLRLIAAHPDHAGGLRFVQYSLRAFLPLAFVIGVLMAGPALNAVVHQGVSPAQFKFLIGGTAVVAICLFAGPLLVFMGRLIEEQRRGIFTYGALAERMGQEFEGRWLKSEGPLTKEALSASDFSATTDLYSIVANVYAMYIVPLELKNLILLVAVTLLPFLPIVFVSVPVDVMVQKLAGLFF